MGVDPDDDAAAKVIAQRLSPQKQAWFDNLALRGAHEYAVELENKNAELERENTALREQLAHWQERTREQTSEVERLQSQLAQVTQERWAAVQALKDVRCIVGAPEIGADTTAWIDDIISKASNHEQPQP